MCFLLVSTSISAQHNRAWNIHNLYHGWNSNVWEYDNFTSNFTKEVIKTTALILYQIESYKIWEIFSGIFNFFDGKLQRASAACQRWGGIPPELHPSIWTQRWRSWNSDAREEGKSGPILYLCCGARFESFHVSGYQLEHCNSGSGHHHDYSERNHLEKKFLSTNFSIFPENVVCKFLT